MKSFGIIAFICLILFLPFLGSVHLFDWDEANFAELAREMMVSGDYLQPQINFLPFYEKPPLFIWFQVLSMKLFGISEFAARFPNVICGILVLTSLYYIGKTHFSQKMGIFWAVSFGASIAPHFYFKTGLIDPFFNYFIFLSIYHFSFLFWKGYKHNMKSMLWSSLFAALAIMTKGPVAVILICSSLGLAWILLRFQNYRKIAWVLPWGIITIALSGIWFFYITQQYGSTYVSEFITYQIRLFQTEDAKHGGTLLFHPIALFLGCFPASIYMWSAFQKSSQPISEFPKILSKLMIACGVVVLVVFSLVQTKIIHYSSMDYYPITFFSALGICKMLDNASALKKWQLWILSLIGGLWAIALIAVPILGNKLKTIKPYIHDKNFLEQLQTPIEWDYWAAGFGVIIGIVFFYGIYVLTRANIQRGIILLFASCILIIQVVSIYYLPRIEQLVQGSMVDFCKKLDGKMSIRIRCT